jgi:hypothetical protein
MGGTIYSVTGSILVDNQYVSNARSRVAALNEEFKYLQEEYADLNLMLFEFDLDDFYDDVVVLTEDARIKPDEAGRIEGVLSVGNIVIPVGSHVFRDFAYKHQMKFSELPSEEEHD